MKKFNTSLPNTTRLKTSKKVTMPVCIIKSPYFGWGICIHYQEIPYAETFEVICGNRDWELFCWVELNQTDTVIRLRTQVKEILWHYQHFRSFKRLYTSGFGGVRNCTTLAHGAPKWILNLPRKNSWTCVLTHTLVSKIFQDQAKIGQGSKNQPSIATMDQIENQQHCSLQR